MSKTAKITRCPECTVIIELWELEEHGGICAECHFMSTCPEEFEMGSE